MKVTALTVAVLAAAPFAYAAPLAAEDRMTAAVCQPLTGSNMEACCADNEWRNIILPGDVRFCPPLNADDKDSGRLGQSVADSGPDSVPGDDTANGGDDTTTGSIAGNPGNAMGVGGAGEKDKDNENPTTGTKGDSN
jgi:hypothetical protein